MPTEPLGILYKIVAEMLWKRRANRRCDKTRDFCQQRRQRIGREKGGLE